MNRDEKDERFLYHGSALALGGNITRPYNEILESQAASVLPTVGGYGSARVENFKYHDLISFRAAYSTVAGNVSGRGSSRMYNTLATVTIEDLNIADMVTADRVVARLVSERKAHEEEVPIRPIGSYFTNLRIAGYPVEVPPHHLLFESRTIPELRRQGGDELPSGLGGTLRLPGEWGVETSGSKEAISFFRDHRSMTSLFERPEELPPGCEKADTDWGIYIPGFGTVYLGEFTMTRSSRRLEMIRVRMGSPVKGEVVVGITEGNGSTYP